LIGAVLGIDPKSSLLEKLSSEAGGIILDGIMGLLACDLLRRLEVLAEFGAEDCSDSEAWVFKADGTTRDALREGGLGFADETAAPAFSTTAVGIRLVGSADDFGGEGWAGWGFVGLLSSLLFNSLVL